MLKNKMRVASLLIAMVCMLPMMAFANEKAVTISAGGAAGGDASATVMMVEYEHALTSSFSLAGRAAYLKYAYDDNDYEEDGNGPGIQISAKFYPGDKALHGFYFGGGFGFWEMDVDWIDDKNTAYQTSGSLSTSTAEIHAELGWRIGDKVQFTPSIQFGTFLSSKLEMAEFLSLNLGIGFMF